MARSCLSRRGFGYRNNSALILGILVALVYQFYNREVIYVGSCINRNNGRSDEHLGASRMLSSLGLPQAAVNDSKPIPHNTSQPHKKLIMVGVMTAAKYINTRAATSYDTWVRSIPGEVRFFSSGGSEKITPKGLPVVALKGVTDTYPPQKKSFLMMKYMHEYHIDEYEWFARVDDDIYLKGDNLEKFLRSLDSSVPLFIGQAGFGNNEEFGKMSVRSDQPYCMGGPGMIFNAATLRKFIPHISTCLHNLVTTHEDVELGRCVTKFANVTCTANYEMTQLFYHNHKDPQGSFSEPLKTNDIDGAITLHPVKNHTYQHRIHAHFLSMKSQHLRHQTLLKHREIQDMTALLDESAPSGSINPLALHPSLLKFVPKSRDQVLTWDFEQSDKLHSQTIVNPNMPIHANLKVAHTEVFRQVMKSINRNARQRGRIIEFKQLLYGYKQFNPVYGATYIFDLLLSYKRLKGRRMTIPVRRHAYIHQAFSDIEFIEDPSTVDRSLLPYDVYTGSTNWDQYSATHSSLSAEEQMSQLLWQGQEVNYEDIVLYFIVPMAGRFDKFLLFMDNFEEVVLRVEKRAVLSVMLFKHKTDDRTDDMFGLIARKQQQYPQHLLEVHKLEGDFSRGVGLEQGGLKHDLNALLVFIDVDMYMHRETIPRIKLNTIPGKQVFFPIVFSQFEPSTYFNSTFQQRNNVQSNPFNYSEPSGYWRFFGFGIAAMYNCDFQHVGGFDKEIKGWGREDVDLYENYLHHNYSVFRAPEPGLVHIYHPVFCDRLLPNAQYTGCLGTKASTYLSLGTLADIVYRTPEILYHVPIDEVVKQEPVNQAIPAREVRAPGS